MELKRAKVSRKQWWLRSNIERLKINNESSWDRERFTLGASLEFRDLIEDIYDLRYNKVSRYFNF